MNETPQSGFCYSYEIRETADKGRGVFAMEPIPKGMLVWRFQPGLYLVHDEESFTASLTGLSNEDIVYELTHVFAFADFPNHLIKPMDDGTLINHDDDANLATNFDAPLQTNVVDSIQEVSQALLEDRFALIATRDIEAGEELTNNYNKDVFDPEFYLQLCDKYEVDESYLDD